MTLDMWNTVIGVNLTGQFLCCREAVREFLRRGVRKEVSCAAGKIICMSSVHQIIPWAGHVDYATSKGGIVHDDAEHRPGSGAAPHPRQQHRPGRHPDADQQARLGHARRRCSKLLELIPYKRIGEPEDIARAAVWLASDYADYVNGTTLYRRWRHDPLPWLYRKRLNRSCRQRCPSLRHSKSWKPTWGVPSTSRPSSS